jgi:hypothetical protein
MTQSTPDLEFPPDYKAALWSDCRLFATPEKGPATPPPLDRPKLYNPA